MATGKALSWDVNASAAPAFRPVTSRAATKLSFLKKGSALTLSGGLCLLICSYVGFVARRIDPRPEDRGDADIAEGAGELGFFSPGSYWPITLAASAAIAGLGLAFVEWWLVGVGVILVLFSVGGLLFEYYTRGHTSPTF